MQILIKTFVFCLAIIVLAYLPGKLLLLLMKHRLNPLESVMVACFLGLIGSSLVYWFFVFGHQASFYFLWPLTIVVIFIYLWWRQGKELFGGSNKSAITGKSTEWHDRSLLLLAALFALGVILLAILPQYYTNLTYRADGTMRVHAVYDVFFHLGIANELTHSIPPQAPVFSGHPLNYHYGMDLIVAMFANATGLNTRDLLLRFVPTLYLGLSMLSVYGFSRIWLKSGYFGCLVVFLVFFGEDFSFIPGWLLHERGDWSVRFFNVPTVLSLFYTNSMLPGIGLLFAGLFCVQKYLEEHSAMWLMFSALLFVSLIETKLFTALHIVCSLGIGAIVYLLAFKATELFKVVALTCALTLPLILPVILRNQRGAELAVMFAPWPYASLMMNALGIKKWSPGPLAFIVIVLPIYLVGCFGLRVIGVPAIIKAVLRPERATSLRFVLALFVIVGTVITLTCRIVPVGYAHPYNNSVWFLAQSKYVAWIFAVEILQGIYGAMVARGARPMLVSSGIMLIATALTVPSTVQHFALDRHLYEIYGKAVMTGSSSYSVKTLEAMEYLARDAPPGDVVLPSENMLSPVLALTRCRVPIGYFSKYLVARSDFLQRETAEKEFWKAWRRGQVQDKLLREANVHYLAVDKQSEGIPETLPVILNEAFSNSECAIFKVQEGLK